MSNERKYFDADKLVHKIYHKIAVWHNNDERLNDVELGRELKFLSKDLAIDVIKEIFGADSIKMDKEKLGMTPDEVDIHQKEKDERMDALRTRVEDAMKNDKDEPKA